MTYLTPTSTEGLPDGLSFMQFVQSVFVGISGLDGTLVRPRWQPSPPKQPDSSTNWLAIGLQDDGADTNAFVGVDEDGHNFTTRMEALEVQCSFYGPDAFEKCKLLRDGFQIPTNLEALLAAKMGFVETSKMVHLPELVNEVWFDRYDMSVFLRRQIMRVYPVLNFDSASGSIEAVINGTLKAVGWQAAQ